MELTDKLEFDGGLYLMKLTTEQSKRVQCLRGLAIIAVVFIHNTPVGVSQVFCRPFFEFLGWPVSVPKRHAIKFLSLESKEKNY